MTSFSPYTFKNLAFMRGPVERYQFANGAVLLFHRSPGMKGASTSLIYNIGSRDESLDLQGGVHLLEHLLFKSAGRNLSERIELMGGELNGHTTKEYCSFEVSCLQKNFRSIFPLFVDLILNPCFSKEDFVTEKKVVMQEVREGTLEYEALLKERMFSKIFSFPLGHPIGGSLSALKAMEFNQVKAFLKKNFLPSRMVLTIVGDDRSNYYLKSLLEIFSKNEKNKLRKSSVKKQEPIRHVLKNAFGSPLMIGEKKIQRKVDICHMIFSSFGVCLGSDYFYDFWLLSSFLSEGMTSELYTQLREKEGLVYSVFSSVNSFSDNGSFDIELSCLRKDFAKVQRRVEEIFIQVAGNGIDESKLKYLKQQMQDGQEWQFDDLAERNSFLALNELFGPSCLTAKDLERNLEKVTSARIARIAQKIIKKGFSIMKIIP